MSLIHELQSRNDALTEIIESRDETISNLNELIKIQREHIAELESK